MNVSLPEGLKAFIDERAGKDGYLTSREYVRELIRAGRLRRAERELADLLRAGLESGTATPVTRSYLD